MEVLTDASEQLNLVLVWSILHIFYFDLSLFKDEDFDVFMPVWTYYKSHESI